MNPARAKSRPIPVALISAYFLLAAAYLWILAGILILAPGKISLMLGSRFMYGLELAGPYMMLLVGCGYALIGRGLFRLYNWARWLAMLFIVLTIGGLVPAISSAQFGLRFFACGLEIAVFASAGFYLAQAPTVLQTFVRSSREEAMPRVLP
jgi:hypothetical protein